MTHAPGHLRYAFMEWVDHGMETAEVEDVAGDHDTMAIEELLRRLAECSDTMPKHVCEELGLPQGSNYANGVGAILVTQPHVGGLFPAPPQ